MLLTTAAIAVGRKIKDEREKKKIANQGLLSVGDSDVAKRAFAHQLPPAAKGIKDGSATGVTRTGTDIKFETPTDVDASTVRSLAESSPGLTSPQEEWRDVKRASTPQPTDVTSPVRSEKGTLLVTSPDSERPEGSRSRAQSMRSTIPPPYSPRDETLNMAKSPTNTASSVYSRDSSDGQTLNTVTSSSGSSFDPNAIRVKTNGSELKSGFPYHPALFDLQVHPQKWDAFTHQIVETTKLSGTDTAQVWAAATATALTGAWITSVWVGRTMKRSMQEKRVKESLAKVDDGGLGDTLTQWNDSYFRQRGLFVHLELSESALKSAEGKSKTFRKPTTFYGSKEEREKKRDERKFVIVISKLEDGAPSEDVIHEMAAEGAAAMPELPNTEDAKFDIAEAPGDTVVAPVELPAMDDFAGASLGFGNDKFAPPMGYAELESDTTQLLEKTKIDNEKPVQELEGDGAAANPKSAQEETFESDVAKSQPTVIVSKTAHEAETGLK